MSEDRTSHAQDPSSPGRPSGASSELRTTDAAHAPTRTAVELEVLRTGMLPTPVPYVVRPDRGNRLTQVVEVLRPSVAVLQTPCLAYVLRHPSAGTVLVDTGFHPDASKDLRADLGLPMSLVFRALRPASDPFDVQLRGANVEPGDVRLVVMTHLHVDHTSGMRLLPNAEFVCAREEWAAAHARGAGAKGYVAHHLPSRERMRLVDHANEGHSFGPFLGAVDLLGDGSVVLLPTPGHTRGHTSVFVRAEGQDVLIVGDAVYTLRSLDEERLPLLTEDDDVYLRSLRLIKALAAERPDAALVPSHDPDAYTGLAARS